MEPPGWGALLLSETQEHMPAQRGMQSSNRNTRKGHSPAQRHRACLRGKCIPVKIEVQKTKHKYKVNKNIHMSPYSDEGISKANIGKKNL